MSVTSTCAITADVISQQQARDLLSSCNSDPLTIEPRDSHFFNYCAEPRHQSFHNGAYIWKAGKDGDVSGLPDNDEVTVLRTNQSVLFQLSEVPFAPPVIREYLVTPPKEYDPCSINRLIMVREGLYTIGNEGYGTVGDTRESRRTGIEKGETLSRTGPDEFQETAEEVFGEEAKKGDCTMANVHFYLFK